MATYRYIQNGNLTDADKEWFSKMNNGAKPTGAMLVVNLGPQIENNYVVFERGTGEKQFNGAVTDWDNDHILYASYSRYLLIEKKTGTVINRNYTI